MSETLVNDSLVNRPVPDLEADIRSSEDFQALRARWTSLSRVPKLVDAGACPVIADFGGQTVRLALRGEESAGSLMVCHITLQPDAAAVHRHHQPNEDELWFCLQGAATWTIGDKTIRVGPGAFAYAPRNTTHAFAQAGDTPAVMFTVNTPAGHERFFPVFEKFFQIYKPGGDVVDDARSDGDGQPDGATLLARYDSIGGEALVNGDSLVNKPIPDLEADIRSNQDYQALRRRWTSLPRIPKLVDGADCPVVVEAGGQTVRLVLKGEESAGALMVSHVTLQPGAVAVPSHHQPREEELWFALQGEWEWTIGEKTMRAGPGSFAYAPRNVTHAFANAGDTAAVMFTINTPAGHERGFQALRKLLAANAGRDLVARTLEDHDFIFGEEKLAY